MNGDRSKLTLDRPTGYQIRVPGQLDTSWSDWAEGLTIQVLRRAEVDHITILTGTFDQAGLHGLLRRLYAVGLPLISVNWVGSDDQQTMETKRVGND